MDITAWLEAEKGRATATARHFGKSLAAISQWKRNGVPLDLMKAVRAYTGNAVTLEEMVPPAVEAIAADGGVPPVPAAADQEPAHAG